MLQLRKHHCVDCHFFIEELPTPSGQPFGCEISTANRKEARADDYSWKTFPSKLTCAYGVWDEGYGSLPSNRQKQILEINRHNFCFWWPYHQGMQIPAAKILQERLAKDRESNHDRRLTILGLFIASLALLANVVLMVAKEIKLWPFH